jgi:hypothetical protein
MEVNKPVINSPYDDKSHPVPLKGRIYINLFTNP